MAGICLDHFIEAQNANFKTALNELTAGKKTSHWICYISPQIAELGYSAGVIAGIVTGAIIAGALFIVAGFFGVKKITRLRGKINCMPFRGETLHYPMRSPICVLSK